jgi:hypothetical protein
MHLQQTFFDCFEDSCLLVLCRYFCITAIFSNLEFSACLYFVDNFFKVLVL